MANQRGLGRGLASLIPEAEETQENRGGGQSLPLGALVPNPNQPRREFDPEALEDLAASIRSQGVLQPILVRSIGGSRPQQYEIVAGERRFRAAQMANLTEVPVLVKELSDQEALVWALIENLQREDLNPLEEARGLLRLKEEFGYSQEELSGKLGKSRSTIANSLRLNNLSPEAQRALAESAISAGHARTLLSLDSAAEQDQLLGRILKEHLTVREAEGLVALSKSGREGLKTEEAESAALDGSPRRKLPESAVILGLQSKIAACVNLPVKISGHEDKGRISISYASKEQLAALLEKFGLEAE